MGDDDAVLNDSVMSAPPIPISICNPSSAAEKLIDVDGSKV